MRSRLMPGAGLLPTSLRNNVKSCQRSQTSMPRAPYHLKALQLGLRQRSRMCDQVLYNGWNRRPLVCPWVTVASWAWTMFCRALRLRDSCHRQPQERVAPCLSKTVATTFLPPQSQWHNHRRRGLPWVATDTATRRPNRWPLRSSVNLPPVDAGMRIQVVHVASDHPPPGA